MKASKTILSLLLALTALTATAQQRLHIHTTDRGAHWDFPLVIDSIADFEVTNKQSRLQFNVTGRAAVPFTLTSIDSLTFADEPAVETKDKYQVFQLYITTNDGKDVTSKEQYKDCHLMLNAKGAYTSFSANAQIRGRGNSSFLW